MTELNEQLADFKINLRSLLLTVKNGIPLNKLNGDYKQMLGYDIPFRQLGFVSQYELLRYIPDTVRLAQRGNDTVAFAITNEQTKHVAELVHKQKTSGKGYSKNNSRGNELYTSRHSYIRTSVPPRMLNSSASKRMIYHSLNLNMPRCVPSKLKQEVRELLSTYPDGLQIDNLKAAYHNKYGVEINHKDFDYARIVDFARALENEGILKIQGNSDFIKIFHPDILNRQRLQNIKSFTANPSEEKTNSNSNLNGIVFDNMVEVMNQHPEGFPLTKLCDLYHKVSGSSLEYRELGYNNVQELINDLDEIFRVKVQRDGEWMLTDVRLTPEPEENVNESPVLDGEQQEIPDQLVRNIYDLIQHVSDGILLSEFEKIYEINFSESIPWKNLRYNSLSSMLNALNSYYPIHYEQCGLNDFKVRIFPKEPVVGNISPVILPDNVPEDAVGLGEVYTPPKVPPIDNDYFPVVVSTSTSPGQIWIQQLSQEEVKNVELDALMDELEAFYLSPDADKYKMPDTFLRKSMNCAVVYPDDQCWHRGSIVGKPGPRTYEVFFYDYGTVCQVDKTFIKLLKKCFSILPAQAFDARLANIGPLSNAYSAEASKRLFDLVHNDKPLMALITNKQYLNTTSVILCDTSGDEDVFLNDLLVKEGLVRVRSDHSELRSPYSASSPDSFSCNPNTYQENSYSRNDTPSLLGAQASNTNFITPLGMPSTMECSPQGFTQVSGPEIIQKILSQSETKSFPFTNPYEPPSLPRIQKEDYDSFVPDPDILRRIESNNPGRRRTLDTNQKESLNVPLATVEPIQVSHNKEKYGNVLVPLSPVNQLGGISRSANQNRPQEIENVTAPQDEIYESSREDENREDPEVVNICSSNIPVNSSSIKQLRFCKRVEFRDTAYTAHLINFYGSPCFTSGDVSSFVFGIDIVKKILSLQKYPSCHILASRENHPELFSDLECNKVSGFTDEESKENRVVLYVLTDVPNILNFLNYNRKSVVEDIEELSDNFDSKDSYWFTPASPLDDLPNCKEGLEQQLKESRKERRSLLSSMMDYDVSTSQDLEKLVHLDKLITRIKKKLLTFEKATTKSAAEQAREFLQLIQINQECDSKQEEPLVQTKDNNDCQSEDPARIASPIETVTAVPATSASAQRTVGGSVQASPANTLVASNQSFVLPSHTSIAPQVFHGNPVVPTMPNFPFNQMQQYGFPQLNQNYFYQQLASFPGTNINNVRFQGNFPNFMNWQ